MRIHGAGVIELLIGASDVGGGTGTSLAQIVAEELGVALNDVKVVLADTALTPFDHGTFSSRVTSYVGAAVRFAAADAKKQIRNAVSKLWGVPQEELRVVQKRVLWKNRKAISFEEVLKDASIRRNRSWRRRNEGQEVLGRRFSDGCISGWLALRGSGS